MCCCCFVVAVVFVCLLLLFCLFGFLFLFLFLFWGFLVFVVVVVVLVVWLLFGWLVVVCLFLSLFCCCFHPAIWAAICHLQRIYLHLWKVDLVMLGAYHG